MRVAHLTSAHPRYDIRIFVKECCTLAGAGHEVTLVVADGRGDEVRDGVRIVDVGAPSRGRLTRMTGTVLRVLRATLRLRPEVAHFHDPELLPACAWLSAVGIRTVYDAHEDVPRQILSKHWIPATVRGLVSKAFERFEDLCARQVSAVVAATPHIRARFSQVGASTIDVCNFPILEELAHSTPWSERRPELCYLGSISRTRGIEPIIAALPQTAARLNLAGAWSEPDLKLRLQHEVGWSQVNDLGVLDRAGVANVLAHSKIGLVTLLPTPSYVESLPIKLFEYMAAGLAVVASDFPLWRDILEEAGCGVLVDPTDPAAIAAAVTKLLNDDEALRQMGENGRAAVHRYSWAAEAEKLCSLYSRLERTWGRG